MCEGLGPSFFDMYTSNTLDDKASLVRARHVLFHLNPIQSGRPTGVHDHIDSFPRYPECDTHITPFSLLHPSLRRLPQVVRRSLTDVQLSRHSPSIRGLAKDTEATLLQQLRRDLAATKVPTPRWGTWIRRDMLQSDSKGYWAVDWEG